MAYWGIPQIIASKFNVTEAVADNRIDTLAYEIEQYINGTPINRIEILSKQKREAAGIVVKSIRDIIFEKESEFYDRSG